MISNVDTKSALIQMIGETDMALSTRILTIKILSFLWLIGPGLLMISSPVTGLGFLTESFLDFAYQPFEGSQPITGKSAALMNAILGGILVGFGVMIWKIAGSLMAENQDLAKNIILTALICWFITDSLGSVLAGAWFNAVINALIFISFLVPLIWKKSA